MHMNVRKLEWDQFIANFDTTKIMQRCLVSIHRRVSVHEFLFSLGW